MNREQMQNHLTLLGWRPVKWIEGGAVGSAMANNDTGQAVLIDIHRNAYMISDVRWVFQFPDVEWRCVPKADFHVLAKFAVRNQPGFYAAIQ